MKSRIVFGIIKFLLLFFSFSLLIIVLFNTLTRLEVRERTFINASERILKDNIYPDIYSVGSSIRRGQQMPSSMGKLFEQRKDLEQIDVADNGTVVFTFSWSNEYIAEGSNHLIYQPDNRLNPQMISLDFLRQNWVLSIGENHISYSGGGTDGRGYIRITRIKPCWFRLEQYYPT